MTGLAYRNGEPVRVGDTVTIGNATTMWLVMAEASDHHGEAVLLRTVSLPRRARTLSPRRLRLIERAA